MVRILVAACAAAVLAMSAVAVAQSDDAVAVGRVGSLAIPHSTEAVAIDGVLDDPIWRTALVLPLTIETYPRENQTPEVETTAYLVENGDQLLIAFDAHDPDPESIRAYLRDRDSAFNDDFVGVVLDTFNDQRRAFEFFVNPFGVQMDLIQDDVSRNESSSWNAIWDSAGEINTPRFHGRDRDPVQPTALPEHGRRSDLGHRRAALPAARAARAYLEQPPGPQSQLLSLPVRQVHGLRERGARQGARGRPDSDRDADGLARDARRRSPRARRLRDRGRARRPVGHHARLDPGRHVQPRFLAGRGRLRAARGERDVRAVLSRDPAVLPRGRRLLREPAAGRVHAHGRGPRRRRQVHGPDPQQYDRYVRDQRRGHESAVPGALRLAYDFARAGERRVRRPLHARLRPSVDDRRARDEP